MRLSYLPFVALLYTAVASADTLQPGVYGLNASSNTKGIHTNDHPAYLSGTVTIGYDPSLGSGLVVTAANLNFFDPTVNTGFSLTNPGPTTFVADEHFYSAQIFNASDPTEYYLFGVTQFTYPDDQFHLTCGTDCDTFVAGGPQNVYEEFGGTLAPAPEPSSLALLGTGALGAVSFARRRWL